MISSHSDIGRFTSARPEQLADVETNEMLEYLDPRSFRSEAPLFNVDGAKFHAKSPSWPG